MNGQAEEITGYPQDTANQLTLMSLFFAKSQNQIEALLDLSKSQAAGTEFKEDRLGLRRRAGRICPVSLTATKTVLNGTPLLIITLNDLSESDNQAKERLALIEESTRVSKLADIGRLAGGIAHELNNPLAILLGYAENLDYLLSEGKYTKEDVRQNLEPIQSASRRMAKIISKMMAMIRHESTELETLSLAQIVRECLTILEDFIKSNSISLTCEVAEEYVRCDSTHIEQVITNIVTNACNALQDVKEDRQMIIRTFMKESQVVLEVWNNGTAIPEGVQKKLFTPFFTTKGVGEGVGLGLYLCYNIMKAHAGEITFKSEAQHGTSFYLSFPRVKAEVNTHSKALQALVIDDDTFFRKMLCQKLRTLGLEIIEARNGQEALQIVASKGSHFDLFFVDVKMPKMNGVLFVKTLKQSHPEAFTVMITGYPQDRAMLAEINGANVQQILSKPIQNSELVEIVHSARARLHKPIAV